MAPADSRPRDPFLVLADPVRRLLLEQLAAGEAPAGALVAAVRARVPLSQPAVSLHLRVLRDAGFVRSRADGARRIYGLDPAGPWAEVEGWLARVRPRTVTAGSALDALGTEIARGRREGRRGGEGDRQGRGVA